MKGDWLVNWYEAPLSSLEMVMLNDGKVLTAIVARFVWFTR
jgi:hypothetical protein